MVVSEFEENLDKSAFKSPRDYAVANAEGKAREVGHLVILWASIGDVICWQYGRRGTLLVKHAPLRDSASAIVYQVC